MNKIKCPTSGGTVMTPIYKENIDIQEYENQKRCNTLWKCWKALST